MNIEYIPAGTDDDDDLEWREKLFFTHVMNKDFFDYFKLANKDKGRQN